MGFKHKQERSGRGHKPLDILNGGGQEGLFAHIPDATHAGIAETMVDLGLREGTFNSLFSPVVCALRIVKSLCTFDGITLRFKRICWKRLFTGAVCAIRSTGGAAWYSCEIKIKAFTGNKFDGNVKQN